MPGSMTDPMIELRHISRYFHMGDQEVRALDGINIRIDAGEYVSIMGPRARASRRC